MNTAFWRSRPVLVTGATGLLGGWLTEALVKAEANVVVLVRDGAPRSRLVQTIGLERVEVVSGSLSDPELLRRTIAEYGARTVFHLAAQTQVGSARLDPIGTLEANVRGTWNLLEAARQTGGVDVINASSDKAYGASDKLPYDETQPLEGRYPYDCSKSCADLICTMYAMSYGLPVAITRCANLFGGGDLNWARVIPGAIRSTLRGEPFEIRSDGLFIRDYLFVEDAVEAYLCLAERLSADRSISGEAFNFGLGERYTVLDVVHKILNLMGRTDLQPVIRNQASNEIREQYMSSEKAARVLGWRPRHSLDEGLQKTLEWYGALLAA
jgi:CDP-glucose 4,6-dehydratase